MDSHTITKNISTAFGVVDFSLFDKQVGESVNNIEQVEQVEQVMDSNVLGFPMQKSSSVNLSEFPTLGTKLTKDQERLLNNYNKFSIVKLEDVNTPDTNSDPRTASFEAMADKGKVATSLTRTKACRLVTDPFLNPKVGETQQFGVCTRPQCTFAHSLEEMQVPSCLFDTNCRFIHGKIDRSTRKRIPDTRCRFRHSFETINEWIKRSGVKRDPLPETSEYSRKPRAVTPIDTTINENPKQRIAIPVAISKPKQQSVTPVVIPEPVKQQTVITAAIPEPVKQRTRRSRWDEKPQVDESSSDESNSDDSSSDESSSDGYSSDDSRSNRSRRRPTRRIQRSDKKEYVIRVPTDELAAIALKAAIERGQYNIRVCVESSLK